MKIKAVLTLKSGAKIRAEFQSVERDGFKHAAPVIVEAMGRKFKCDGAMDGKAYYREEEEEKVSA